MWPNPKETAEFDTFTEEILNGKLHFLQCEKTLKNFFVDGGDSLTNQNSKEMVLPIYF